MDNLANAPGKHRGSMRDLDSFLLSVRNFTSASGPHHNDVSRQTQSWRSDQESFLRRKNKRNSAVARSQDQVKNKNWIWWMMFLKLRSNHCLFLNPEFMVIFFSCTMNAINKTLHLSRYNTMSPVQGAPWSWCFDAPAIEILDNERVLKSNKVHRRRQDHNVFSQWSIPEFSVLGL